MKLEAVHTLLTAGESLELSKDRVAGFFKKNLLVRYDEVQILDDTSFSADTKDFWSRLEEKISLNRRVVDNFIKELQESGYRDFGDLKKMEQGYESKVLHLITHMLDGFFGADTVFYNLEEGSHGVGEDFKEKIKGHKGKEYAIQEYILGVPIYIHYFQSPLTGEIEVMSFDKRYESNVDSLGRISARDQMALKRVDPSYVIVGNLSLVVRESFLPQIFKMGENVIKESKKLTKKGLYGPFCLETIFTPKQEIYVFEISARIVAPRALACSRVSITKTPAPSPITKPLRSASNGRLAR